jgi:hypothetical protein
MDPPPPLRKINILWSKRATAAFKNIHFTVLHCNRPLPRWNFPIGATGAGRAGDETGGAGAGAGGAGTGGSGNVGKVSAGISDHSSEGFLTTHRSHCSITLIPLPPHNRPEKSINKPPPRHRPTKKTIIRGR